MNAVLYKQIEKASRELDQAKHARSQGFICDEVVTNAEVKLPALRAELPA
jgi:hypothetical protein